MVHCLTRLGGYIKAGLAYKIIGSGIRVDCIFGSFCSMGPRQIRCESCYIRSHNTMTGASPYESLMVADVGDVPINVFNIEANIDIICKHVAKVVATGCKPLILGGDHFLTYPVLRAMKVCRCYLFYRLLLQRSPKLFLRLMTGHAIKSLFTSL